MFQIWTQNKFQETETKMANKKKKIQINIKGKEGEIHLNEAIMEEQPQQSRNGTGVGSVETANRPSNDLFGLGARFTVEIVF